MTRSELYNALFDNPNTMKSYIPNNFIMSDTKEKNVTGIDGSVLYTSHTITVFYVFDASFQDSNLKAFDFYDEKCIEIAEKAEALGLENIAFSDSQTQTYGTMNGHPGISITVSFDLW